MTSVMFYADYTDSAGTPRTAGEVAQLPDEEAYDLATRGIVSIRTEPHPTEYKAEDDEDEGVPT